MAITLQDQLQAALGDVYVIERELAPGGMSRLFLAVERSLDRRVVVKILPPELASEVSVARFQREIALTAHLQHPHVIPILSTGAQVGLLFYIAPYVEGESLRHRLTREGRLPLKDALRIIREIADALSYAHSRGVVHRDVKPENILLQGDHALLADFGIARALGSGADQLRLTATGTGLGTPRYMAPEQLLAGELAPDARSDIYALGVVSYEILTGSPPFADRSSTDAMVAQLTGPPPPVATLRAEVPARVSAAITRALALSPDERQGSAAELRDAMSISHSVRQESRPRALVVGLGGAAIFLFLLIVGGVFVGQRRFSPNSITGPPSEGDSAFGPPNAVAVLPFTNLSPGANDEYFSDGMTEDLMTALSHSHKLRVAARTSAFAFKGKEVSLAAIARQLHVRSVVEGSVRRADQRLRVSARLVDARNGYEVWSENFDRTPADMFTVQDEIARAIADAIGKTLDTTSAVPTTKVLRVSAHPSASTQLARPATRDLPAYDLYLQARAMREQRGGVALQESITLLKAAIDRDSTFAAAYAALALTYVILPAYAPVSDDSIRPLILTYAKRALSLDSLSVEAEIALGQLAAGDWRWSESAQHLQRAISLDSSSAPAHLALAILLRSEGRFSASMAEHKLAASLDPLSPPVAWNLGITLLNAGQFKAARSAAHRAIQLAPNSENGYWVLIAANAGDGENDSASRQMDRVRSRISDGNDLAAAAFIYGTIGRKREGEAALQSARHFSIGVDLSAQ